MVDLDSRFQKLHLGQLVPGAKLVEESVGALDGRVQLKGTGTSMAAVLGIYARETGQGMLFQDDGDAPPPVPGPDDTGSRPRLRVVK